MCETQEHKGIQKILENCTKSNEAFLLLLLDNSWDTWTAYAESALNDQEEEELTKMAKDENMKHQAPVPKWMAGVYCHGRNPGWSQEAKVEYEKLFDMVAENWEEHKNTNVEQFIMEKWKADSEKLMMVTVMKNEGICVHHEDFF